MEQTAAVGVVLAGTAVAALGAIVAEEQIATVMVARPAASTSVAALVLAVGNTTTKQQLRPTVLVEHNHTGDIVGFSKH